MSEIKGCIFDLDGVLVETSHFHYLAWSRLGKEFDIEVTSAVNEQLKGVSRRNSLEVVLAQGNIQLAETEMVALENRKNTWYLEYLEDMSAKDALPNVVPFLDQLASKGIKLAVGSSSKNAVTILHKLDLHRYFSMVVDGNGVKEAKPNPEIFLNAAKGLHLAPDECVVFEDAISGIEAARAGGFKCIGIGQDEVLNNADLVIPSFQNFDFEKLKAVYQPSTIGV